ncbi:DUF1841 domain-containing protein [Methylotenera oryzisoli]|uniref:DUF1841 domain-containing protein n=1 Tax=Methylotenera oryzisoli TaxID=2080758 RepID=A0A4Y9VPJ4_9PROT|nr:DUF1841 family protein [Methylotenera oryzisoli]TFW70349.1 DUF1841 domain-containing protein [Methylotenera oryzisoli]
MSLYNPSRDQARQFLFDAWAKFKQHVQLSDLEKIAIEVMQMHPEYHTILDAPERYMQQQYFPEMGETNPFLHLSLHLSVIEQISINQPIGIHGIYEQLKQKHQDQHLAQHDILECLAETIWQSQRNNTPLDSAHYLSLLQQRVAA